MNKTSKTSLQNEILFSRTFICLRRQNHKNCKALNKLKTTISSLLCKIQKGLGSSQHLVLNHHFQILLVADICDHQNQSIQLLLEHLFHSLPYASQRRKSKLAFSGMGLKEEYWIFQMMMTYLMVSSNPLKYGKEPSLYLQLRSIGKVAVTTGT